MSTACLLTTSCPRSAAPQDVPINAAATLLKQVFKDMSSEWGWGRPVGFFISMCLTLESLSTGQHFSAPCLCLRLPPFRQVPLAVPSLLLAGSAYCYGESNGCDYDHFM